MVQKTIDEVMAEAAIRDVQIRYCRAVDRMDYDLLRSCFHTDAVSQYGFFSGGVDDFVEMAKQSLANYIRTTHFTGNQLVEVSGDSAWAEHYTVATHRCAADDDNPLRDFVTAVRYVDRMERRDGDWRIATRQLILDWYRTDPVEDAEGGGPDVEIGKRDRTDASYSLR